MHFQKLAARLGLATLLAGAAIAAVAVAGVRLDWFGYATGLLLMWPATALGLVALVLACAWLRSAIANNDGTAKRLGLVVLAGSLLLLVPPLSTVADGFLYPPIHDAGSNPDDPPQFVALALARTPAMNDVAFDGQQKIHYRGEDVTISYVLHTWKNGLLTQPHTKLMPKSKDPVATVFWSSFESVKALGWKIVDYDAKQGRIEATAASPWFGQVSDIVIRVRPSGFMGARADVRAQSRFKNPGGATDNGFNMRLVRDFKKRAER